MAAVASTGLAGACDTPSLAHEREVGIFDTGDGRALGVENLAGILVLHQTSENKSGSSY
jgi:hypothetical protein